MFYSTEKLENANQAIIWTNNGQLPIVSFVTNFGKISIKIQPFSLKKISLKHCLQNSYFVLILVY